MPASWASSLEQVMMKMLNTFCVLPLLLFIEAESCGCVQLLHPPVALTIKLKQMRVKSPGD